MKKFLSLFVSFFKIGLFTFGGGYAMLPLIEKEIVDKHKWITETELLDIFSLSQVTPGPIAINAATYLGYKVAGFFGSVFATLGVVLPSFCVIVAISLFLLPFMSNEWVMYAFEGIRVGIVVLMVFSVIKLTKVDKKTFLYYILLVGGFVFATFTEINIIFILLIAMGIGIFYACLKRKAVKK